MTTKNRSMKNIDRESVKHDRGKHVSFTHYTNPSPDYLNNLVNIFNSSSDILDKHAPLVERTVTVRDKTPWSSADIRPEKQKRRKLEKRWKKTKLHIDYENFKNQKNKMNKLLNNMKNNHMAKLINENKNDPRTLFKTFNSAIHGPTKYPILEGNLIRHWQMISLNILVIRLIK